MSTTKRQEEILELLNEHGFLTVERLSEMTYTSPSSVRRDLARLQALSLIKRTHGGASAFSAVHQAVPLSSRMTKNVAEKRKIARLAATLLHDGQSVMLDGSSTAGFLIPYIAKHKDMTVFTNNMLTAINAVNHGVTVSCTGGVGAYRAVAELSPDIFFFSAKSLSRDGVISDPIEEENHIRALALENAKMSVFLCDGDKFGTTSLYKLTSLDRVDVAVFDKPFHELKTKCKVLF